MNLIRRAAASAALSTLFVVTAATTGHAQANPIAQGHGTYIGQNLVAKQFTFSAVVLPGGAVRGHLNNIEHASNGFVHIDVTSLAMVGDTLMLAGPITQAVNAPPHFVVGATGFFLVNDNARNTPSTDTFAGLGVVPPFLGNLTAEQILAFAGPPPPQAFAPLLSGDIRIRMR